MDEASKLMQLIESSQTTIAQQDSLNQVLEFEKFLAEMSISVKKRHILNERESVAFPLQVVGTLKHNYDCMKNSFATSK